MNTDIKVLGNGLVRLVEATPNADATVVRAARVSHGSGAKTPEEDKKLIAYMLKNDHGSPFEHNNFTFHIQCPIFVVRQWHRHRIGVSYNEISARYTEMKDEFYTPDVYRAQDTKNRQGSIEAPALDHATAKKIVEAANFEAFTKYQHLLSVGVAKEMARMVLPVNMLTEFYFSCNARSLMAFIKLRSESHAQWEIRQYSNAMASMFHTAMPWTYEAFYATLPVDRYPGLPNPVAVGVHTGGY